MSKLGDVILRDTTLAKPAAGVEGRLYYDTDLERLERDNGATWDVCEPAGGASGDATTLQGRALANTAPSDGQAVVWNATGSTWEPGTVAGGGGIAHSYVGRDAIGASTEVMTKQRVYLKKITLTTAGMLQNISAYVRDAGDFVLGFGVAVYADAAGIPDVLLATSGLPGSYDTLLSNSDAAGAKTSRWLHLPVPIYLTAGDYWLAFGEFKGTVTEPSLNYDTSGVDKHYDSSSTWFADGGRYTIVDTTRNYSIRASILA